MTFTDSPRIERYKLEAEENWCNRSTPAVKFPSTWPVKILMPFGRAVARLTVTNDHGIHVSVYFDDDDSLGVVGRPYWEVYPIGGQLTCADDDDTQRFLAGEEDQMIEAIAKFGDPVRGAAIGLGADPDDYDNFVRGMDNGGAQGSADAS